MDSKSIAGEYQLQGVRETASGFLLKPDGDFQFFFSYGALDRYGSGKWKWKNNEIIFNSAEKPGEDFALLESKKSQMDDISVKINDKNKNLLHYVYASLQKENSESWQPANKEGMIRFPGQKLKDISLIFEFCPEKISTFTDINRSHNDFTFRFEPWIMEVFFKDFMLKAEPNGFAGRHPLLKGDQFLFARI